MVLPSGSVKGQGEHPTRYTCDARRIQGPCDADWGHPQIVVCAYCADEGEPVVLALVTQRVTPLRSTLLVPACTPADVERLELKRGDWTLWPVRRLVDDYGATTGWVAVLSTPVQFVRCPHCETLVRLDCDELRAHGPASRALVA